MTWGEPVAGARGREKRAEKNPQSGNVADADCGRGVWAEAGLCVESVAETSKGSDRGCVVSDGDRAHCIFDGDGERIFFPVSKGQRTDGMADAGVSAACGGNF